MRRLLAGWVGLFLCLGCAGLPALPELPPLPDFEDWELEELEERLETLGWSTKRCMVEESKQFTYSDCVGRRDEQVAVANLTTYGSLRDARWAADDEDEGVEGLVLVRDGRAVLAVEVHLPKEAHVLAELAYDVDPVGRKAVKAVLQADGWAIVECFEERGRKEAYAACAATKGERWAMLSVSRFGKGPSKGRWHKGMAGGIVKHERGPLSIEADVQHSARAQALLDALIQPEPARSDLD